MDHVLRVSGVEAAFLRESVEVFEAEAAKQEQSGQKGKPGARARQVFLENSSRALRCTILLRLTGKSYRGLSLQLGMSVLYRWFVGMDELGGVKVPGKSTLQRYPTQAQ